MASSAPAMAWTAWICIRRRAADTGPAEAGSTAARPPGDAKPSPGWLSPARRVGLRDLLLGLDGHGERVQRLGFVDVEESIVATGQGRGDVVSQVLVLGAVDHADRPLAAGLGERTLAADEDQELVLL